MKFTTKQYAEALYQAIEETNPEHHDRVLENFLVVLKQQGDLEKFPEIEIAYNQQEKIAKGIKTAEITTTRKLSHGEEVQIVHGLNKYLGDDVELKTKIDQGILGGIIVRFADRQLDGSLKRKLHDLQTELNT